MKPNLLCLMREVLERKGICNDPEIAIVRALWIRFALQEKVKAVPLADLLKEAMEVMEVHKEGEGSDLSSPGNHVFLAIKEAVKDKTYTHSELQGLADRAISVAHEALRPQIIETALRNLVLHNVVSFDVSSKKVSFFLALREFLDLEKVLSSR